MTSQLSFALLWRCHTCLCLGMASKMLLQWPQTKHTVKNCCQKYTRWTQKVPLYLEQSSNLRRKSLRSLWIGYEETWKYFKRNQGIQNKNMKLDFSASKNPRHSFLAFDAAVRSSCVACFQTQTAAFIGILRPCQSITIMIIITMILTKTRKSCVACFQTQTAVFIGILRRRPCQSAISAS